MLWFWVKYTLNVLSLPSALQSEAPGAGDLNETKATGDKHRALCPLVATPQFAQLWPCPQTSLKP